MTNRTRREFLTDSLLAAAAAAVAGSGAVSALSPALSQRRVSPSDIVRIGVVGVRGRGRGHVVEYRRLPDAQVVAICDADEGVISGAMKAAPEAKYYKDIRKMLEDDSIDVISIASPNHWHALMTVWAMQSGKHVYVEKPIGHNVLEGRRVVEAARAHGKVVQHGTQARSYPATRAAIEWLRGGGLGRIDHAVALCYKRRESIGKVSGPQQPPATCDYDLWTGPAELLPLMRKELHYDWHWDFNTGNGDLGNQGVHQMDIARWGLGKDELPTSVTTCGGRLGYDDDGNTPNTVVSSYDYGDQRLIFEVRGLETDPYHGARVGVVFHCEHGYLVSASYGKVVAFDKDGQQVKVFTDGDDSYHYRNFLDAVKAGSPAGLHAESLEGHLSSALCHLGNISYRLGKPQKLDASDEPFGDVELANESFRRFRDHLVANGLDAGNTDIAMGPTLAIDPAQERFVGDGSAAANALLTRHYRVPFVVPDEV